MRRVIMWSLLTVFLGCNEPEKPTSASPPETPSTPETPETIKSDNIVDNIQLVDLDNQKIDLQQFRGKTVFLNFWATWCKPCIAEMPSIERAQGILESENFVFLLASDESIERITRFKNLQDFNLNFVKLNSPFPDLGVYSIPATFVIDPQGKITLNQVGALEWDAPEVLEKLRATNL